MSFVVTSQDGSNVCVGNTAADMVCISKDDLLALLTLLKEADERCLVFECWQYKEDGRDVPPWRGKLVPFGDHETLTSYWHPTLLATLLGLAKKLREAKGGT